MLRLSIQSPTGASRFATERREILVGRRPGVDLQLEEPAASRNHCVLRIEDPCVRVIDLGSVNGTHVNGRRTEEALVRRGATVRIGKTVLRIDDYLGATGLLAPIPGRGPAPDFATEVRRMFRSAPWYMFSLVGHLGLFLLLWLLSAPQSRPDPAVTIVAREENAGELVGIDKQELPEVDDVRPEPEEEIVTFEEDPDTVPVLPSRAQAPANAEFAEYLDIPKPVTGPGKFRIVRKTTPSPAAADIEGADIELNAANLDGDHDLATAAVKRRYGRGLEIARRRLTKRDIWVVDGEFDSIQKVLDKYDYEYTLVTPAALAKLNSIPAKMLFVNCGRRPRHDRKLIALTRAFVADGGWMITSDWAIHPYVAESFPHLISTFAPDKQIDATVAVESVSRDPILHGVFPARGESIWWLEGASEFVRVRSSPTVDILVTSEDMSNRFGSRVVVFRLRHGTGMVLHLLGHFWQESGNRRGLVGMHTLINNVIMKRFGRDD